MTRIPPNSLLQTARQNTQGWLFYLGKASGFPLLYFSNLYRRNPMDYFAQHVVYFRIQFKDSRYAVFLENRINCGYETRRIA